MDHLFFATRRGSDQCALVRVADQFAASEAFCARFHIDPTDPEFTPFTLVVRGYCAPTVILVDTDVGHEQLTHRTYESQI